MTDADALRRLADEYEPPAHFTSGAAKACRDDAALCRRAADAIEENARLRTRVVELEEEIEKRDNDDFNAMVEADLAD